VFTIAIPVLQDKIDSKEAYYAGYKFNLQQASLKHAQFVTTYDNGHFLDIIIQDKMVSENHIESLRKIQNRLMLRCQELLADATIAVSVDPSDKSDDSVSRHIKLRHTPIDELSKVFDSYTGPNPTSIGHKFVVAIANLNWWKIVLYCTGSILFILGTFLQVFSKRTQEPQTKNANGIHDPRKFKQKTSK